MRLINHCYIIIYHHLSSPHLSQIVDGDATPVVGTEEDVEGTVGGRGSQGATQDMGRHGEMGEG